MKFLRVAVLFAVIPALAFGQRGGGSRGGGGGARGGGGGARIGGGGGARIGGGGSVNSNSGTGAAPYRFITYADRLFMEAELIKAGVIAGDAAGRLQQALEESFKQVDYVITKYVKPSQAVPWLRKALALARSIEDPIKEEAVLRGLASALMQGGKPKEALVTMRKADTMARNRRDYFARSKPRLDLQTKQRRV